MHGNDAYEQRVLLTQVRACLSLHYLLSVGNSTFEREFPSVIPELVVLWAATGHLLDEDHLIIQVAQWLQTLPSVCPSCIISRIDVDHLYCQHSSELLTCAALKASNAKLGAANM